MAQLSDIPTNETIDPTHKLFHQDPYCREADATVLYVKDDLVVLDQTIFYAESGGQAPDAGWIDEVPVIDVQKIGGRHEYMGNDNPYGVYVEPLALETVIAHRTEGTAPFEIGQRVHLKLDWPLRYLHMRNHSASHFLYQAVASVYSKGDVPPRTKGCYIHAKSSRFDYGFKVDAEGLVRAGEIANELIARGKEIAMEPDPRTPEVSYWKYEEIVIPCGGTHVGSAVEVGPIRLKRSSQGKHTDRIYAFLEQP